MRSSNPKRERGAWRTSCAKEWRGSRQDTSHWNNPRIAALLREKAAPYEQLKAAQVEAKRMRADAAKAVLDARVVAHHHVAAQRDGGSVAAVAPMPNTMAVDAPKAEWRVANVTVDATFAKEAAQRAGFVLRAPDGGAAVLVAPGTLPACVASLDGLTFDDRGELATLSLEEEHPAVALAGTWRPASQLGALEGGAGAWALDAQLVDDEGGAPSTVDAWALTLCTDGEVAVPLEKAKGGRIFARDDDKLREDSDADLVRRLSAKANAYPRARILGCGDGDGLPPISFPARAV